MPKVDLTLEEVAEELEKIFERNGVEFSGCLVKTVEEFAANHGDITAARLVTYARVKAKFGEPFTYLLNALQSADWAVVHTVRCFIPAKKEVAHD